MDRLAFDKSPDWDSLKISKFVTSGLLSFDAPLRDVAAECKSSLSYLATPYSNEVVDMSGAWVSSYSRLIAGYAAYWAGELALAGVAVTSPIVQADAMVNALGAARIDPLDGAFWSAWCSTMLITCERLIVPPISGRFKSRGIYAEVNMMLSNNRRVYIMADDSGAMI